MMSLPTPYEPDEQERAGYFYGLAGKPRLVARTTSNRWTEPLHVGGWNDALLKTRKEYLPVVDAEMKSKWNNELSFAIINALEGCSWSYFFPIRIGLERTTWDQPQPESATVLLIAVEKDSLKWQDGIIIASKCREIVRSYGIADVEVEIREGRYEHHGGSEQFENQLDAENWCSGHTNEAILPMLPFSGYPVGYYGNFPKQGTVGLHLRLSEGDKTSTEAYGLTCRHVVCKDPSEHGSYKLQGDQRQYHLQSGFLECMRNLASIKETQDESMEPLLTAKEEWETWYIHDKTKKHKRPTKESEDLLVDHQRVAAYNAKIIEHLAKLEQEDKRKIGHLAYHPSSEISSLRPGYFKDWGLIELNPDKFVNGPKNKVFIGTPEQRHFSKRLENGFLNLVLSDEVRETALVGKRGATTGLTFGTVSGIEAVIRRPNDGEKFAYAWEMLIVPKSGYKVFSDRGDSGAAIFNQLGQIVGMVTASTNSRPEHEWGGVGESGPSNSRILKRYPGGYTPEEAGAMDVTFAAPIQWVLEDIQAFTGQQAKLA